MTSAKHISYAHAAQTRSGWAVIRVMENVTGRTRMLRRARGFQAELEQGQSFWNVMTERYGLTLDIQAGALSNIPTHGPVVLVANHPYGILDGLMLGHILDQTRGDFRVLANDVFRRAPALADVILPISFDATKEAAQRNIQTRAEAHKFLLGGGRNGRVPRRNRFDPCEQTDAGDGSVVADLYRQDDHEVPRDSYSNSFRRRKLWRIPVGEPNP